MRPAVSTAEPEPLAARRPAAFTSDGPPGGTSGAIAVLLLVRLRPGARVWGWSRIVRGARALRGTPGLRFARALGSGQDGGFGLRPSLDRQGLFALFGTEADARRFVDESAAVAAYRAHADEMLVAVLRASSCRGSWGGATMAVTASADPSAPVAALTRASIKPLKASAFWRHSPPSEAALAGVPGCRLAVGLGEAPVLRQATFSLWDNVAAMDAYARSGAHGDAIRAAMQGRWFSESMFVRFVPLRLEGRWKGRRFD